MLSKPQLGGTAELALESGGHPQVASIPRRCSQMVQTHEASPRVGEYSGQHKNEYVVAIAEWGYSIKVYASYSKTIIGLKYYCVLRARCLEL